MNFGALREIWRQAYRATTVTQQVRTIATGATGKSEKIPLPNLDSDLIAIGLHGTVTFASAAGQADVDLALVADIVDNLIVTDPQGKSVLDLSFESLWNYCSIFPDDDPNIEATADVGKAGTVTKVFDIIVPIFVPRDQGVHQLQFDWSLANCYGGDVTQTGTIDIYVMGHEGSGLEKWKAVDQMVNLANGNVNITTLEHDRGWYAVFVEHLVAAEHSGVALIDDVALRAASYALIQAEYPDLNQQFLQREEGTQRYAGDTLLNFRYHQHKSTDYFMLEGTHAGLTATLLLIAEADPSRSVTTPEKTSSATGQTAPGITMINPTSGAVHSGGSVALTPSTPGFRPLGRQF